MSSTQAPTGRLLSLDVFRGATIAGMMLVNNPGDWGHVYAPLLHAKWHGWTFTDLIFPFFLWIVGVAMTLSFAKRVERGDSRQKLLHRALAAEHRYPGAGPRPENGQGQDPLVHGLQ